MKPERRFGNMVFISFCCLFLISFSCMLSGCGGGSGSDAGSSSANQPTGAQSNQPAIDQSGLREDVIQYINNTYPDSGKKRAALTQYAKAIQYAYTQVNNEVEAQNAEPQIIRALSCVREMGEIDGSNAPSIQLGELMVNTPERLAAEIRYEKFIDGKVFTISSPGDTAETYCDFNPSSFSN